MALTLKILDGKGIGTGFVHLAFFFLGRSRFGMEVYSDVPVDVFGCAGGCIRMCRWMCWGVPSLTRRLGCCLGWSI